MSAAELIWPDLDDVGYEFWREAQAELADGFGTWAHTASERYRTHWQHSPFEAFPACGRGHAMAPLTRDRLLVTCRACRRSGSYREAS